MVVALCRGHIVKLAVPKGEKLENAYRLIKSLEAKHNFTLGRLPYISSKSVGLVIWLDGHAVPAPEGA